jgi:hypothetical protein|tara:strand:+ start:4141 stop:4593 length:453 start_codon:yes stop_codon:yes gene_type:complete
MKKLLTYLFLLSSLTLFPSSIENSTKKENTEITCFDSTFYVNKMHVNSVQWNAYWNGNAHFKSAISNTTWNQGYYWNVLYIYGESRKNGVGSATYITNFKVHAITPYGDQVIYQDRYLLINFAETRAISSLYNLEPNTQYFITWDSCTTF